MHIKKRIAVSLLALLLCLAGATGAVFAADPVEDQIYPLPDNIDVLTQTFANGDGTYTMYIETDTNTGQMDPLDPTAYIPPSEDVRYTTAHLTLSRNVYLLSAEIVKPSDHELYPKPKITYFEDESGRTFLQWTMDLGMQPTKFYDNGFPHFPRNTLKITFKPYEDVYGKIVPLTSGQYTAIGGGPDGQEPVDFSIWLNAVMIPPPAATITTTFYEDAAMTKEATAFPQGAPIFVKYVITNPESTRLYDAVFSQSGTLSQVTDGNGHDAATLSPGEELSLETLEPGTSLTLTGIIDTSQLINLYANTGKITTHYYKWDNAITPENTVNDPAYKVLKAEEDMGDETVEPRFSPDPDYGNNPNGKVEFIYLTSENGEITPLTAEATDEATIQAETGSVSEPTSSAPAPAPAGTVTPGKGVRTGDVGSIPVLLLFIAAVSGALAATVVATGTKRD